MVGKYLHQIVTDFIDERDEQSLDNLDRYMNFGIKCIRDLHMRSNGAPSVKMLPIDENTQTVKIPDDCITVLAIAELTSKNDLKLLTVKDGMVLNEHPSRGFGGYASFNGLFGKLFDAPSVYGAAYKIDPFHSRIKVSEEVKSDCLYVEYLADIQKIDGKFIVHPYDEEAVMGFIRYANIRSNMDVPLYERREAKSLYEEARDDSIAMNRSFTMKELKDAMRKAHTLAPRG